MQPPTPPSKPTASAGRAAPPAGSWTVPAANPLPPPTPEADRRSAGRIFGAVAVSVVLLVTAGMVYKILARQPNQGPRPAAAAPAPTPNTPAASAGSAGPHKSVAPAVPPSGVAMPSGNRPGWRQTFAEDFNDDDLSKTWYVYDGQPGGDAAAWFDSSHVGVADGLLTIGAWRADSPNGNIYVSGGLANSKVFAQTYGLYQIRFKIDKGWGIAYTIQLWPASDKWPPEIDIVEDNGKDRQMTSATLHYGRTDTHVHREVSGDWTGWHTAEVEWSAGRLVYRIDGRTWTTMQGSYVPSEPMWIAIQTQPWGCGGGWEACPNKTTPTRVNLQVDWVVAYAKA